jgi:acetyl esterase/lipase
MLAEGYTLGPFTIGGVEAEWADRPGTQRAAGSPTLIGVHGGGFVLCTVGTHRRRFAAMAGVAGWRSLTIGYRLAPEHPFPAGLDDVVAVCRAVGATGPYALVGDSAGAGLLLSAMLVLRDRGGPAPVAAVLISPWADLTLETAGPVAPEDDPFGHLDDLPTFAAWYLGGADPRDPLASPLFGDPGGLPPLLIQVGTTESLFGDAIRVAERARSAGVEVELEVWTGMFHTWHGYLEALHGADEAIASIGDFLRRHAPR